MPKYRMQKNPYKLKAFKKGFNRYGYLESDTPVTIAVWVFDFPDLHGLIDTVFNARPVKKEYLDFNLDIDEGVKNAVHFFLLDGQTLKAQKLVGLHPEAVWHYSQTVSHRVHPGRLSSLLGRIVSVYHSRTPCYGQSV